LVTAYLEFQLEKGKEAVASFGKQDQILIYLTMIKRYMRVEGYFQHTENLTEYSNLSSRPAFVCVINTLVIFADW
jgi:hypothetical protein